MDDRRCRDAAECRAAFGLGFVCADSGRCERAEPNPRCATTFPVDLLTGAPHPETFVIGSVVDGSVTTHQARAKAVRLAVSQIAERGGLEGRPLGVVFCTNEVDPVLDRLTLEEASVSVARHLASDLGVPAIIGPPSSGATERVFEALAGVDTVLVSPSATSPRLTDLEPAASDEVPGRLWRTAPPDSLQGAVIAGDMAMRGVGRVAVIAQEGAYGSGLADVFMAETSAEVTRLDFASSSARDEAATTAGSGAFEEVLFISSQTSDVVAFLLFADAFAGFDDKTLFVTDSAANEDLLVDAAAAAESFGRLRGTRPAPQSGLVYDAFLGSFAAAFGGDDASRFSFTAHAYDAAWLVLLGASWASLQEDAVTGSTIARGMRRLSGGTPLPLRSDSWAAARDRFRLGERVDVTGASGELDFDPQTEETSAPIEVFRISDGGDALEAIYAVTPG